MQAKQAAMPCSLEVKKIISQAGASTFTHTHLPVQYDNMLVVVLFDL